MPGVQGLGKGKQAGGWERVGQRSQKEVDVWELSVLAVQG